MKNIKLTATKEFLNENAINDINNMKSLFILGSPFIYEIKYKKDLTNEELNCYNLFINNAKKSLKSRNKSSAKTNHSRAKFFEINSIYHHHLIDENLFNSEFGTKINHKTNKKELFKISTEIKNIENEILNGYHTSGLCIHYQKIEHDEYIEFKIIFISIHPKGDEWSITKDFVKNKIIN